MYDVRNAIRWSHFCRGADENRIELGGGGQNLEIFLKGMTSQHPWGVVQSER